MASPCLITNLLQNFIGYAVAHSFLTALVNGLPFFDNRGRQFCGIAGLCEEVPNDEYRKMVGLGGLEPPASPLSGVRSNQLSYRP